MKIFGVEFSKKPTPPPAPTAQSNSWGNRGYHADWDGDKFAGGFGATKLFTVDYWTLRARSDQLFTENMYARGIIRRLVTNEINTGLSPEALPDEGILGVADGDLGDWTEDVESRFKVWGDNPLVCDWNNKKTFGSLQRTARREALISGDVLVVLRQSQRTKMPIVELLRGDIVQSPIAKNGTDRNIEHGVETNPQGRVVAYWIKQKDGSIKRQVAFGPKTGRRIAWLVFGTDKRIGDVRGQPLLALIMQSLKEVDRYRDSVQRKATINSMLAMFIQKDEDKPGTLPLQGGAVRQDVVEVQDATTTREKSVLQQVPGWTIDELQVGEKPVAFDSSSTELNFGAFEATIMQAVAWANEIPPEILTLAFSNNYSASQAALNEFKIYLNMVWERFGHEFCTPIYVDWIISETLLQRINAPGLLESWRDLSRYEEFGAWITTEWNGKVKPATDMLKTAKGSALLVDHGWSNNAREARQLTGTRFSTNTKRLKRENEQLADAMRPMLEIKAEFSDVTEDEPPRAMAVDDAEIESVIGDYLEEHANVVNA